jgi:hypothetical protein
MNVVTVGASSRRLGFSARHVLGETHPRLRQCEPKGLVFVAVRSACHRYALLGEPPVIIVDPHFTSPRYAIHGGDKRRAVRQRRDHGVAEYGRRFREIWRASGILTAEPASWKLNDSFTKSTFWDCERFPGARPCVRFLAALQQYWWCNAQVTLCLTCDSGWELPGKELRHVQIHCPPLSHLEALRRRRERAFASQRPRIGRYRHQPLGHSASCMDRRASRAVKARTKPDNAAPAPSGRCRFWRCTGIGRHWSTC